MTTAIDETTSKEVRGRIDEAARAKKCWTCGCLHGSLAAIERAFAEDPLPGDLARAIAEARNRLEEVRYDCLGCAVCFPALAINALNVAGADIAEGCPANEVEVREGWPPLPGDYFVRRFRAPVAVSTLTDLDLARSVAEAGVPALALAGTLQTENLGIERVIRNVLANPNIRFLVLCGEDSRRRVGHLPGQSLLALAQAGLDEKSRIIGARGSRPVLRNIPVEAVERFRRTVEVVDRIGTSEVARVLEAVEQCGERDPGPADPFEIGTGVGVLRGHLPERMVLDPAGYFVLYVDRRRSCLSLEHFGRDGALDGLIEGGCAAELYTPAIERGFLTRLDHAAYLGRELARAEAALAGGAAYVQDGAPERARATASIGPCGCESSRGGCP